MKQNKKLSYNDFKSKYLAKIPHETIAQLEKLHGISNLEKIIEQDSLNQYNDYLKRLSTNDK